MKEHKNVYVVQWHITDRCQNRCKHCYMYDKRTYHKEILEREFPFLKKIVDDLVSLAVKADASLRISLMGGDPLLYPDFWKLLHYMHKQGIHVSIGGNPNEITKNVAKKLYNEGVRTYQMSLEGPPAISDPIRGGNGNFDQTIKSAEILTSAGILVNIMFTLSMENKDYLFPLMDQLAFAPIHSFSFARASIYGNVNKFDIGLERLKPKEYRKILINYLKKEYQLQKAGSKVFWSKKCHLFAPLAEDLGLEIPSQWRSCLIHSGGAICILSDGTFTACRRMHYPLGRYPEMSIEDAFWRVADLRSIVPKECQNCSVVNKCLGCRAVGHGVTKSLEEKDIHCWR